MVLLSCSVLQELREVVDGIVHQVNFHGVVRVAFVVLLRHHPVVPLADLHVPLFFFRSQLRP